MRRRLFLSGLLALPAVTYFDMGASWKRREQSGLYVADWEMVDARPFLKKHYDPNIVRNLVYRGPRLP